MKNKMKYLWYLIAVIVLSTIFHFVTRYMIESGTPPFIASKLDELRGNEVLMDSIGGYSLFEFTFNKYDFELADTVRYTIKIKGKRKDLTYKGVQLRTAPESWRLIDDTLIIE